LRLFLSKSKVQIRLTLWNLLLDRSKDRGCIQEPLAEHLLLLLLLLLRGLLLHRLLRRGLGGAVELASLEFHKFLEKIGLLGRGRV